MPLVILMMDVVSLSTWGTRALKTAQQLAEEPGEDVALTWDSKVDKFDKRLLLVRKRSAREGQAEERREWEAEVKDVSLYEFWWKYYVKENRVQRCNLERPVALMVTPALRADAARVDHGSHGVYARTCVVAFWRMMATKARYELLEGMTTARDRRRWGGSFFEEPAEHAGFPLADRLLGVRDLVAQFDAEWKRTEVRWRRAGAEAGGGEGDGLQWVVERTRGRGWKFGWAMALMEMVVDPVLSLWVPAWVVEQYKRWNPKFGPFLAKALEEDAAGVKSNREILARVRTLLERDRKREEARRAEEAAEAEAEAGAEAGDGEDGGGGGAASGEEGGDEAQEHEDMAEDAILRGDLPVAGGGEAGSGAVGGQSVGRRWNRS